MARAKPSLVLEQGRFHSTYDPEEEVLLEVTIPLVAGDDLFRIGWSLKGLRHSGWIAISTGQVKWKRSDLDAATTHVLGLLQAASWHVEGVPISDIR